MMKLFWFTIFVSSVAFLLASWLDEIEMNTKIQVWEIESKFKRLTIQKSERARLNASLRNSYIVLESVETEDILKYTIYYLTGNLSELKTKLATIDYVVDLKKMLKQKVKNCKVIINKETYGRESQKYQSFSTILLNNNMPVRRMYKMNVFKGKPWIVQVLPEFTKLNKKDLFVLDSHIGVYIFSANSQFFDENRSKNDEYVKYIGQKLAKLIEKYEHKTNIKSITRSSNADEVREFFSLLSGSPEITEFTSITDTDDIQAINCRTSNTDTHDIQTETNVLYCILDEEILEPCNPLEFCFQILENLQQVESCYILTKRNTKEIFLFILENSDDEEIRKLLKYGEKSMHKISNNFLVSVVQTEHNLIPFVLGFDDLREIFLENNEDIIKIMDNISENLLE